MGPISYEALVEKHFDAWSKLEGFKYSKEELFDLHRQVKPQKFNKSTFICISNLSFCYEGVDKERLCLGLRLKIIQMNFLNMKKWLKIKIRNVDLQMKIQKS